MIGTVARRTLLFALLWWAMSEGVLYALPVAAMGIVIALAVSLAVAPPGTGSLDLLAIARFIPFFVARSVVGGVDVSRRVLSPALPIDPGFVRLPLRVSSGAARSLFVSVVGLLPGTLSVHTSTDVLTVHVLDSSRDVSADLRELERRVASMFGERIES